MGITQPTATVSPFYNPITLPIPKNVSLIVNHQRKIRMHENLSEKCIVISKEIPLLTFNSWEILTSSL